MKHPTATPTPDLNAILRPAWRDLAAIVFARLDGPQRAMNDQVSPLALMEQTLAATEPCDMTPEELDLWLVWDDLAPETTTAWEGDTETLRRLRVRTRLALLRLCAGLGSLARLAETTRPGAVTLVEGIPVAALVEVSRILQSDLLPLAQGQDKPPRCTFDPATEVQVITPRVLESTVSRSDIARLDDKLADIIDGVAPIVILLPAGAMPSSAMLALAPGRILLPQLDRAALLRLFTATHPAKTRRHARAIAAALPPDDRLAAIPELVLLAALRHPDPRAVARNLAERHGKIEGPRLADLPDSAAARSARALIADLRAWRDGRATWDEIPHALLLYGPPGTGKSFIARAMAAEPGLRFVRGSFAEWQANGHLGDMLKAMSVTFAEARAAAPCVLFIDEIDSAGSRSGGDLHGQSYRRQVVNGFLLAIDQLNLAGGVLLVGACNDPSALDPAVLRPGRFDHHVEVPLPDRAAIAAVLRQGIGPLIAADEIGTLARQLLGYSMAAVDALIRAAKSSARQAGRRLTLADLKAAIPGPPPNPTADWRIAVHEAGHAVVAHLLSRSRVLRISMGPAGGLTERTLCDWEGVEADFADHLATLLAGRAAERVVLGSVSGGSGGAAHSDLAQATRLAMQIETRLGLGGLGPVWVEETGYRDPDLYPRIRARIEAAEARAASLIAAHREGLIDLARALLDERELSGDRLEGLLVALDAPDAPAARALAG
jgi:DNA polymerase III delta prime subunit